MPRIVLTKMEMHKAVSRAHHLLNGFDHAVDHLTQLTLDPQSSEVPSEVPNPQSLRYLRAQLRLIRQLAEMD